MLSGGSRGGGGRGLVSRALLGARGLRLGRGGASPARRHHGQSWIVGLAALGAGLGGAQVIAGEAGLAASQQGIAGEYVCKVDCRYSDAPPGIEVAGASAKCQSQLGGVFDGRVLSSRSVFCFNMIGTLSADGNTVMWSNGGRWVRRR